MGLMVGDGSPIRGGGGQRWWRNPGAQFPPRRLLVPDVQWLHIVQSSG